MRRILLALAYLAATTAAPVAMAQNEAAAPPPLSSVALPPELDRVLRDYERAWKSGDAKAVAALFAEDGFVLQSGRMPIRGRAAIASAYAGQAGGPLRLRAFAYATSDTTGFILGAYGYGDGETVPDMGKFTVTLRRPRGGAWQIMSDMDNANQSRRQAVPAPQ
jgi:uncharacterized protein (TIGR02246 family)